MVPTEISDRLERSDRHTMMTFAPPLIPGLAPPLPLGAPLPRGAPLPPLGAPPLPPNPPRSPPPVLVSILSQI